MINKRSRQEHAYFGEQRKSRCGLNLNQWILEKQTPQCQYNPLILQLLSDHSQISMDGLCPTAQSFAVRGAELNVSAATLFLHSSALLFVWYDLLTRARAHTCAERERERESSTLRLKKSGCKGLFCLIVDEFSERDRKRRREDLELPPFKMSLLPL